MRNEGIIKMGMGNLNYICSYFIFSNLRIYLGRKAIIDIIGAEDSMCKCTPAFIFYTFSHKLCDV